MSEFSIEAVRLQGAKAGLSPIECEKFFNFYESKGWLVGKTRMKSLPHAIAGWKLRLQTPTARYDSVYELRSILDAKEKIAAELKNRHSYESPFGLEWDDQIAKAEYMELRQGIRELTVKLARLI